MVALAGGEYALFHEKIAKSNRHHSPPCLGPGPAEQARAFDGQLIGAGGGQGE